MSKIIGWFSCGITSAVACKIAINMYKEVELYYTDTGSQDDDSFRFLLDCEEWYGRKINIVKNDKYKDHFDVIKKKRFINSPFGAPCTKELKKAMRYKIEDELKIWDGQVFGYDISEIDRATHFSKQYPASKGLYPLIEVGLTKEECAAMLLAKNIALPKMYKLGYHNNNCIGCVKGGMGYWNKIRVDFPDKFNEMADLEQEIGHSCLKDNINGVSIPIFLKNLEPHRGDFPNELMPDCGLFCQLDFMDLIK